MAIAALICTYIRGQRIRAIDVLELLAADELREQTLLDFPYLESDDIPASLLSVTRRKDHPNIAGHHRK